MKRKIYTGVFCGLVCLTSLSYADQEKKRVLKSNSTLKTLILPKDVDTLSAMFTEGVFYGRLRFNSFLFDWDEETEGKRKDHYTMGVGGSLIYKSAYLHGFGVTAGLYTTQGYGSLNDEEAYLYKVGKGVFSRYDVTTKGKHSLTSLAQSYVEYKDTLNSFRLGRQIFESQHDKK